jgi:geranylgeranyl diphosphate synthase, type I
MPQSDQLRLVNQEIEGVLLSFSGAPAFQSILRESPGISLTVPEHTEKAGKPWPLLPLAVCEAICGQFEQALPAAAALNFMKTAAEVFDDIEDADSGTSLSARYGAAVAINIGSTLLILAEKTLTRLQERRVGESLILRVINGVNSFYTAASLGQHMDLSMSPGKSPDEEQYLEMVHLKSASTLECACQIGALLANSDRETIDKYTKFGYYLGMASQIANDIQGITSGSDILKRKITLPVIFTLTQGSPAVRRQMESYFYRNNGPVNSPDDISGCLFRSGGVHYSLVKMELFKQQALDFISEEQASGKNMTQLKLFAE